MGSGEVLSAEPGTGLRLGAIQRKTLVPDLHYLENTWEDEPLTPTARLFLEPSLNCVCLCILGFKNPVQASSFKELLEVTLMRHKRFSSHCVVKKGRQYWEQVKASANEHVFEVKLSDFGTKYDDFVLDYAFDKVMNKPLDKSKPLWDCHILNIKIGDSAGWCIFRIHHSLGDGTSLISLLMALTRRVDKPDELPTIPVSRKKLIPSPGAMSIKRLLSMAWLMLTSLYLTAVDIWSFMAMILMIRDSHTWMKGNAGVEHQAKKCRVVTIKLDDIRLISKAAGATINDALMGIVSCGIRRYLEAHELDSLQRTRKKSMPVINAEEANGTMSSLEMHQLASKKVAKYRVRALAFTNNRPSPGLQELKEMMKGKSQARWGNFMGYVLLPLTLKSYSDPLDFIRWGKAVGTWKKASIEGLFTYATGALAMKLLGGKATALLTYRSALQTTMSLSNVVGPTEEVMFAGNPVTHIIPSVVGHPHALTLHMQTYNGTLTLIGTVAKETIPDIEVLLQHVRDAAQEIQQATLQIHK